MRKFVSIAAIALAQPCSGVLAADHSAIQDDQLIVEIAAIGVSEQQAIKIFSACTLSGYGESTADARGKLEATKAKLRQSSTGKITFAFSADPRISETPEYTYAAEAAADAVAAAVEAVEGAVKAAGDDAEVEERYRYSQQVEFSGRNAAAFLKARKTAEENGCDENYRLQRSPNTEIADGEGAKAAAMKDAIAKAWKKADLYADSLNMRVVRMRRVSEVGAIREFLGADADILLAEMQRDMSRRRGQSDSELGKVRVTHSITVDFIFGPK